MIGKLDSLTVVMVEVEVKLEAVRAAIILLCGYCLITSSIHSLNASTLVNMP